jgi:serine/threonine protein kinase
MNDLDIDLGETVRGLSAEMLLFDRFKTKRILGRGGMGVVWLAEDQKLKRDVALKFLPEVVAMDAGSLGELRKEARNGMLLSHPNLVRMLDLVEEGPSAAIVMEFVDGTTLSELRLQQPNHVFDPLVLKAYVDQLLDALHYAHTEVKMVHRDLKPANVMVNRGDAVKLADFGIASCVRDSVSRISLQANSAGTLVYVSPQQLMGELPKPADDIYSLGAMLYELLTGKPPFYAGDISKQIETRIPPFINERRKEFGLDAGPVPDEWQQLIHACLEKDHRDRPANINAVRDGLNGLKFTRGSGETKARTKPRSTTSSNGHRPALSLPPWLVPAGIGAVLVASTLGWYYGIYRPEEQRKSLAAAAEIRQRDEEEQLRQAEAQKKFAADSTLREHEDALADAKAQESKLSSARQKKLLWNKLALSLKEYDYPYGDQAKKLRQEIAVKEAEWQAQETAEQTAYQNLLSERTRQLEDLRTLSAKETLGATPKRDAWQKYVSSWNAVEFNPDYGDSHTSLLEEAQTEAAKWESGIAAEKPSTPLNGTTCFQNSAIASWNDDGKKAGVLVVQNALKTAGYFNGKSDGIYTDELNQSIMKFQESKQLPISGRLDQVTLDALAIPTSTPPTWALQNGKAAGGTNSAPARPKPSSSSDSGANWWDKNGASIMGSAIRARGRF